MCVCVCVCVCVSIFSMHTCVYVYLWGFCMNVYVCLCVCGVFYFCVFFRYCFGFFIFNDAHLYLALSIDLGHWCPCLGVDPTLTAHQASAIPPDYALPMTQM